VSVNVDLWNEVRKKILTIDVWAILNELAAGLVTAVLTVTNSFKLYIAVALKVPLRLV